MRSWRGIRQRQLLAAPAEICDADDGAAREVAFVLEAAALGRGDRVLHLQACRGCHGGALTSAGLTVEIEAEEDGTAPMTPTEPAPAPAGRFRAVLLFGATHLPFWEVEEAHRARLRRLHARLARDGILSFGDPISWPRPEKERDRLRQALPSDSPPELRRLLAPRARFTHYTPVQLRLLLGDCGFTILGLHNQYAASTQYDHEAAGMIVIARRS